MTSKSSIFKRLQSEALLSHISSLTPITGGAINLAYKVQTDSQNFMLKLLVDDGFTSIDRNSQFHLQQVLADMALAPSPVWLANDQSLHLEEWVHAPTLDKLQLESLAKIDIAIGFMAKLHSLNPNRFVSCEKLDLIRDWHQYLDFSQLCPSGDLAEKIRSCSAVVKQTDEWVFCHNDIAFAHVVHDTSNEQTQMLDWEYAALGDRYFDLAGFIFINELTAEETEHALCSYAEATAIPLKRVEQGYIKQLPVVELTVELWTMASEHQPLAFY